MRLVLSVLPRPFPLLLVAVRKLRRRSVARGVAADPRQLLLVVHLVLMQHLMRRTSPATTKKLRRSLLPLRATLRPTPGRSTVAPLWEQERLYQLQLALPQLPVPHAALGPPLQLLLLQAG